MMIFHSYVSLPEGNLSHTTTGAAEMSIFVAEVPWGKPWEKHGAETSACEKAKFWRSALELATWKVVEVEMFLHRP